MVSNMKKTLDFYKAMHDTVCPDCGVEIEWSENSFEYAWEFECCKRWRMIPIKAKVETEDC